MTMWINDTDIADMGLELTALGAFGAGMTYSFRTVSLPGSLGHIVGPYGVAAAAPRVVPLVAVLPAASIAVRNAALTTVLSRLTGLLELRFSDEPDRVLYGLRTSEVSAGVIESKSFVNADLRIPIEITCFNPVKHDRFVQSAAFSATRAVVPVGSLPHGGKLYVLGAATDPTITYRNMAGDVIATMAFTATLGADDYLVIDLDMPTITRYDAGVASNGLSLWTGGDFFAMDPGDADVEAAAYPTLEVSSGAGLLLYRRAWGN